MLSLFLAATRHSIDRQYVALLYTVTCHTSVCGSCCADLQVLPADMTLEDTALFYARAGAAGYDAAVATYKVRCDGKLGVAAASDNGRTMGAQTNGSSGCTSVQCASPAVGRCTVVFRVVALRACSSGCL